MLDLAKRREEVIAGNALAEKTRGSGWHPGDPGAVAHDKEPRLSERPVVLQHNEVVFVIGPCADKVREGCRRFLDKLARARKKATDNDWPEAVLLDVGLNYQRQVERHCKKAAESQGDLALPTQEWNYVNHALGYMGFLCVSATAEVQSFDDC
ncbi:MAG: hypothetical protein KGL39_33365 [Patescibacteria group bacterium]|nr:hypothetical protein [Patescibacteria group bacterium]